MLPQSQKILALRKQFVAPVTFKLRFNCNKCISLCKYLKLAKLQAILRGTPTNMLISEVHRHNLLFLNSWLCANVSLSLKCIDMTSQFSIPDYAPMFHYLAKRSGWRLNRDLNQVWSAARIHTYIFEQVFNRRLTTQLVIKNMSVQDSSNAKK